MMNSNVFQDVQNIVRKYPDADVFFTTANKTCPACFEALLKMPMY